MYIWFLQESCGGTCGSLTCRCLQGNLAKIVFCVLASLGWVLAILLYLVCPSMNLVRGTKLWDMYWFLRIWTMTFSTLKCPL